MNLTTRQKAVLVGTVLGDAYLQKTGEKNARLRFEHSLLQKEYLLWKTEQFPRLFLGKPDYISRVHPKTKRTYEYVRHQSNSSPELGKWRAIFYEKGTKKIPGNLAEILTHPLSLAVWYMDDGYFYRKDHNAYIYLGTVSPEEAECAKYALLQNFGIQTTIYDKKKKGFALFFSVLETKKLHAIVAPYMVLPLFSYKLLEQYTFS